MNYKNMSEDSKKVGEDLELDSPEQATENEKNTQEYLDIKSKELLDLVDSAKSLGSIKSDRAAFSELDALVANFKEVTAEILIDTTDDAEAKEKIKVEFANRVQDVEKHKANIGTNAEVDADIDPDSFEDISGDTLELEELLEVNNAIGVEVLVKSGATFRVYGELKDSVIKVEPGGTLDIKGTNTNNDIIDIEIPVEEAAPEGDENIPEAEEVLEDEDIKIGLDKLEDELIEYGINNPLEVIKSLDSEQLARIKLLLARHNELYEEQVKISEEYSKSKNEEDKKRLRDALGDVLSKITGVKSNIYVAFTSYETERSEEDVREGTPEGNEDIPESEDTPEKKEGKKELGYEEVVDFVEEKKKETEELSEKGEALERRIALIEKQKNEGDKALGEHMVVDEHYENLKKELAELDIEKYKEFLEKAEGYMRNITRIEANMDNAELGEHYKDDALKAMEHWKSELVVLYKEYFEKEEENIEVDEEDAELPEPETPEVDEEDAELPEPESPEPETPETEKPKPTKLESLESDLGYLDIDSTKIFENLDQADMEALKGGMSSFREAEKELEATKIKLLVEKGKKKSNVEEEARLQEKIQGLEAQVQEKKRIVNAIYGEQIKKVFEAEGREEELSPEVVEATAERINKIILDTISLEANRLSIDNKLQTIGKKMLKTTPLMVGASLAIGTLNLPLVATGLLAGGASWAIRRAIAARSKKSAPKLRIEQRTKVDEAKNPVIEELFSDLTKFKRNLSGHMSNALRQETSETARERLKMMEAAKDGVVEIKNLGEVTEEAYLSALTHIDVKYPDIDPEKRQNMAMELAMNLSQYQRGQNEAKERLEGIKKKKPGLYKFIEKYNLMSSTGRYNEPPADMNEEEKKLWQVNKYDLLSLGIGGATGIAVRSGMGQVTRAALGAIGGGSIGYVIGEELERKSEGKVFEEIDRMIGQAESLVEDLSFPSDKLDGLRESRNIVKARLEMGILDNNPLLKSRAENFIHNFQKVELANQATIKAIVATLDQGTKEIKEQVDSDISAIEKKTKRRKLLATVSFAVAGGLLGFFGADLGRKALAGIKDVFDNENVEGPRSVEMPEAVDQSDVPWPKTVIDGDAPEETSGAPKAPDLSTAAADNTGVDKIPAVLPTEQDLDTIKLNDIEKSVHFEDTVDSSEVEGSDSIWKSARNIFEKNASAFGYKGDPEGIGAWAESQTASVVAVLTQEQDGNLADLVHDGDKVTIDIVDGKPHLSFEASSGIEAGELSDANVSKLTEGIDFKEGIEHSSHIDASTGDAYIEVHDGEDAYKIYDWDRDGNPNVIMPDGSTQEMTSFQLQELLESKDLLNPKVSSSVEENAIPDPIPRGKIHMSSELTNSNEGSDVAPSKTLGMPETENSLNPEFINGAKLITVGGATKFMEDHNIGFKDNRLVGLSNVESLDLTAVEKNVETITFSEQENGNLKVEIKNSDNVIKNFEINQDSKWSSIPEDEIVGGVEESGEISQEGQMSSFESPSGSTANFEYNTDGSVRSVATSGIVSGKNDLLIDDFGKDLTPNEQAKVEVTSNNLRLYNEILQGMEDTNKGDTPEAGFLRNNITRMVNGLEKQYGDIVKDLKVLDVGTKEVDIPVEVAEDSNITAETSAEAIDSEDIDSLIEDSEVEEPTEPVNVEDIDTPMSQAVEGINIYKPGLEFTEERIETGSIDYLNKIREASDGGRVIAEQGNNLELAEAYKELISKIDAQIENLNAKQAA
jgi:hypothetical protein